MTCFFTEHDTPPTGWTCVSVSDLVPDVLEPGLSSEDYMRQCVVCGTSYRYMHTMQHPLTGVTAEVGCECAGHMTSDPERSRARENGVRNSSKRRQNFPSLNGWRQSRSGGQHLKRNGRVYSVRQGRFGGYSSSFKPSEDSAWVSVPGWYKDFRLAALAAYDAAEAYEPTIDKSLGDRIEI